MKPRIHIVSGLSSAGKSVYIRNNRNWNDIVLFPKMLKTVTLEQRKSYLLHYNLLRPYLIADQWYRPAYFFKSPIRYLTICRYVKSGRLFDIDPCLKKLSGFETDTRCTMLLTSRQDLLDRISQRTTREMLLSNQRRYQQEKFARMIITIDLALLHSQWIKFLKDNQIEYNTGVRLIIE